MAACHILQPCVGVLILSAILLSGQVVTQGLSNESTDHGPAATPQHQKDSLEETVIAEMLRIVDQKFDSLSARISVLERSVNSLNFYSVRQFREIADSIEASTATVDSLHSHLGKVDKDSRAVKAAVSQTGRHISHIRSDISAIKTDVKVVKSDVGTVKTEVDVLKSDSLKMFEDIANSIVYFNENVGEKTDDLKTLVKQTMSTVTERQASDTEDSAVIVRYLEDHFTRPTNCNVNFRPLEERIDLRFAEMKRQTHIHFVDLINAGSKNRQLQDQRPEKIIDSEAVANPGAAEIEEGGSSSSGREEGGEEGGREGERVMRLLANMTQNVMEAVSYFRHTGAMMEQLLHTTNTMEEEQSRLRYDVLEASRLLSSAHMEGAEVLFEDMVNNVPEGGDLNTFPQLVHKNSDSSLDSQEQENNNLLEQIENGNEKENRLHFGSFPIKNHIDRFPTTHFGSSSSHVIGSQGGTSPLPFGSGSGMKDVAEESLRVLSELTKNGTQLLDVLTDLAQLSSNKLTQSVAALQVEVRRLEKIRFNEELPASSKSSDDLTADQESSGNLATVGDLHSLQNTTKTIFSIVEAIASNTGWIPYIFHNMQHVERLANRTLELAKRSVLSARWNRPRGNEIPSPLAQERQLLGSISQVQALDHIYDISIKLQRIMPALTKLVAEPEPLLALAEGRTSREGRVEIYYKGHWGSVCRLDMGHSEAEAVCKHLGYTGGVWAGTGQFELRDDGRHWLLNVTCLQGRGHSCPLVMQANRTVDCPSDHFSVICDHMLRMMPIPGISDVKTGLISIHHRGRWLPVCSHGWSGYEARVACKQMGFLDGREFLYTDLKWREVVGEVSTWVSGVQCTGEEVRLDACEVDTYTAQQCVDTALPAAVRCQ